MPNRPPKILFILHLPPPVHGAALVGKQILDSQRIKGLFNCRFVNLSTSQSLQDIGKGGPSKLGRYIQIAYDSLSSYLKFKPDLVYLTLNSHGPGFYKDAILVLLLKMFGVRMVYHLHNKGVQVHCHKRLDDFLYKKVFRNVDVILLSKNLYGDLQKYVPENKVHICPNGIPNKLTEKGGQDKRGQVILLFVSNLYKAKGPLTLIEACRILQEKGLEFQCLLVGDEGDITNEEICEAIEMSHLSRNVKYLGPKYGAEKEKIYSQASVFCFPSENECFPLVLLEAMSFNLPIITTCIGGIPDIVRNQETGFLIPPNNPEELAEKLQLFIYNPELGQQLGNSSRKRFEKQFTLEHFENRLSEILQNIIAYDPVGI